MLCDSHSSKTATVATVLTVAVFAALLGGCSGRPDAVEHRELASAPKRLSDTGPPAGRFQQRWQATVRPQLTKDGRQPEVRLLGRHVVVA